ncbi:MAG: hypothetical protein CW338_11990 [Clostridiales bacterium]|nr:hypothetical protein [Clostridiales bacterium]
MATYRELVEKYKKRQRDTLVDTITGALSYADNVVCDLGLMEETGLLAETLEAASGVLPFAVIAVTEGCRVVLGRKKGKNALRDGAFRAVKTGAAMGAGALAAAAAGTAVAAIPAVVLTRIAVDRYKSRALTQARLSRRTQRMRELKEDIRSRQIVLGENVFPCSDEEVEALLKEDRPVSLEGTPSAITLDERIPEPAAWEDAD